MDNASSEELDIIKSYEVGNIISPILQMRELRHRKVKQLVSDDSGPEPLTVCPRAHVLLLVPDQILPICQGPAQT